ncbi:tetratricopeptide repeat protein [Thalassotalea piscium]|uniref:Sel1 repeat family protein n=1 Tax=Thalassotalea piscium TaxID=1230533 RepID=A0A7X0NEC1_9GAMM|nr:tetratricopeptide repeat protein [Thalassotalea piscium]MBB6541878.1 hypothetical protein [Thalassotalea piscium]
MNKWTLSSLLLSVVVASSSSFAASNNNSQHINENDTSLCTEDSCKTQILKLKQHSRYGNPETLILLATAYLTGEGVEKNPALAYKKIKRAARSRYGKAMFILSAYYRDGIGTEKDLEKSKLWLARSAAEGYPQALYQTALLTLDFNKADNSEELELLLRAEDKRNKDAMYLLSRLRETGSLVEKNTLKAAEGYKKLTFWNYKDSRERLVNLVNTTDESAQEYTKISALDDDIETLTITGNNVSFELALSNTIDRVTRNSFYDGRSTGSRISGATCSKRTNCRTLSSDDTKILMGGLGGATMSDNNF